MGTLCGIPRVLLGGSRADWTSLVERAEGLRQFDLEWWIDPLLPILGKFVDAARGATDRGFWNAIYKRANGSGGPYISGWIMAFFPYLRDPWTGRETIRNRLLNDGGTALEALLSGQPSRHFGTTNGFIPSSLAPVPFEWKYLGDRYEMQFVAGSRRQ